MRLILPVLLILSLSIAGCTAPDRKAGKPPERTAYEAWGAKLHEISQITDSEELLAAGLDTYRRANKLEKRKAMVEEMNNAIRLFAKAADLLYEAWERYPEYKKFIIMELDKVYGYIDKCILERPYYFDPTDPMNVYGGALTYEQRRKMQDYRQRLRRWESTSGR